MTPRMVINFSIQLRIAGSQLISPFKDEEEVRSYNKLTVHHATVLLSFILFAISLAEHLKVQK
jgi:hypothetical protein